MAADPPVTSGRFSQLPPAGSRPTREEVGRLWSLADPADALRTALTRLLGSDEIHLVASGREALRLALAGAARERGRREVVIPAYTCFSVASAAVAAGLRVRLVDVDARGRIDAAALASLPLEGVAAIVVCNLFGVPEAVAPLRKIAETAGCALIDDAAQALGAATDDGAAGARGDLGVLSFGRGKPLSALGGGALVGPCAADAPASPPRRLAAAARGAAYALALSPHVFPWLAAIPALGIGETRFDPDFARGAIDGAALALAGALADGLGDAGHRRAVCAVGLARACEERSGFRPLLATPPEAGVYPRLALLAPNEDARDGALRALEAAGAGASAMYPSDLGAVEGLSPHLEGESRCPAARDFAAQLLTLPSHGGLTDERRDAALRALAEAAPL